MVSPCNPLWSEESPRFFFAHLAVEEEANTFSSRGLESSTTRIGTSLTEEQQRLRNDPARHLQH